jgi:hypothetical protein
MNTQMCKLTDRSEKIVVLEILQILIWILPPTMVLIINSTVACSQRERGSTFYATCLNSPKMVFFFEMGANLPSLYIKMIHTALFIKPEFIALLHHNHGSIKVAAQISHRNKEQAI